MKHLRLRTSFSVKCTLFCLVAFILPMLGVFGLLYREAQYVSYQEAQDFLQTNLTNVVDSYEEVLKNTSLYHLHPLNDKKFMEYNTALYSQS